MFHIFHYQASPERDSLGFIGALRVRLKCHSMDLVLGGIKTCQLSSGGRKQPVFRLTVPDEIHLNILQPQCLSLNINKLVISCTIATECWAKCIEVWPATAALFHLRRAWVWWSGEELIVGQLCSSRDSLGGPCAIVDVELAVRVGGHGQQLQ